MTASVIYESSINIEHWCNGLLD